MKSYIAFFDLDHTILTTSSGKLFLKYAYKENIFSTSEILKGTFIGIIHRLGIINTEKIIKKWAMKYKGAPESESIELTKKFFRAVGKNHFRTSILNEIKNHRDNGASLVILSAASNYVCNEVNEYLKFDDIICTELEVKDGLFTGHLKGEYCYGRVKLDRAIDYCNAHGFTLEKAYYYGDSLADKFLLESVGNPVCVAPDWRLIKLSRKRNWRVIEN